MVALKIPTIPKTTVPTRVYTTTKPESDDDFRRNAPEILDVPSAARFVGVCDSTILDLVANNAIPHKRIGRRVIFGRRALVDWVNG